ncbi:MAG: VanZ family protein [Flavisolibacter sp.]
MLKWKLFRSRILAVSFLIIITFLFCLPGSAFPKDNWLTGIGLDKIVHVSFFATLLFLWRTAFDQVHRNITTFLLVFAVIYGFLIEIIQSAWVPNRSFEIYDVVADAGGSVLGIVVWWWVYKKNKPL